MNLVAGNTIWTEVNKIPYKYTYLSDDIECDVAIIGAGITGAICSYYLTEAGVNTVILDKNLIGFGSTSASTSILQYEVDYDLIGLKAMIGLDNALTAFRLCNKAVYDIKNIIEKFEDKCDFSLTDCFYYTFRERDVKLIKEEYEIRKKNGFSVEYIDEKNSKDKFSFPVKAGIYSTEGAAQIDPYRFTHELINQSVRKGLNVYENTEITSIDSKKDYVVFTTRNKFNIKAKKIEIAEGFESPKYIDKKICTLYRSFTIATKSNVEVDKWSNRCIIRDTENPYTYVRSTSDNRIIIGGEDEKVGGKNSQMANLTDVEPICKIKYDILYNRLKSMFPSVGDVEIEYSFNGLFADTKDGLPYVGEYAKMPNCYFCLGYGSNGIIYAILCGQIIRDLYLGNYSSQYELFKLDR